MSDRFSENLTEEQQLESLMALSNAIANGLTIYTRRVSCELISCRDCPLNVKMDWSSNSGYCCIVVLLQNRIAELEERNAGQN